MSKAAIILSLVLGFGLNAQAVDTITVSGLSSGGYFANQMHISHSSWIKGAGILAAGPFGCAKFGLADAFYRCMETSLGLPDASDSIAEMRRQDAFGQVDPLENLKDSKVYVLSGTRDATVSPQVVVALAQTYQAVGVKPVFERNMEVGHAFPTRNYGNDCREASKPPYISSCGRDIAGEMLKVMLGVLRPPLTAPRSQILSFSQAREGKFPTPGSISMAQHGVAYVPATCRPLGQKDCRVHVAFHGCRQTRDLIGDDFFTKTGYNEWAQANDVVVVYPQTIRTSLLGNPRGCWDWWGYTGSAYYTKAAPQIQVVSNIARAFMKGTVRLSALKKPEE